MHIPALTEIHTDDDGDEQWSESKILRDWIDNVERPDQDAALNWDTLTDYKLFLVNPEWTPRFGYSLWVEHSNGVEFPILKTGMGGMNTSKIGGGNPPIEVGNGFKEELYLTLHHFCLFPDENLNQRYDSIRFPTEFPDDMSELEVWAIDTLARNFTSKCMREQYDHLPYELAWIVEDTIQSVADAETDE